MFALTREAFVATIAVLLETLYIDVGDFKQVYAELHKSHGSSYIGVTDPLSDEWARKTVEKARVLLAAIPKGPSQCSNCGKDLTVSIGPDRYKEYRGLVLEVPSYFNFLYCPACGAEWLTARQVERLSEILERRYAEAVPPTKE